MNFFGLRLTANFKSLFVTGLEKGVQYCFLSHKLRCYTGISGPEKSCNNISEKIRYFFKCVDIASQLLTHSPLAPLGQVDE